jgi:predicted MPP superfamily phosphohydrolase
MRLLTRRSILKGLLGSAFGLVGGYALAVEPGFRLRLQPYALTPPGWTSGLRLRIGVIADVHAGEPYMSLSRIEHIVAATNALQADLIVLLGDYVASRGVRTRHVPPNDWARALSRLEAPLGVHAILGNADWWDDAVTCRRALGQANIPILENDAVRLVHDGQGFWLAGLGDQISYIEDGEDERPVADLDATLAALRTDEPAILLAHEPKIFADLTDRFALTLSGHTHGGQVRLFGWSPISADSYGNRYAYGHVVENGRHLIVSGGLGLSKLPVRLGVPPEIVLIELGTKARPERSRSTRATPREALSRVTGYRTHGQPGAGLRKEARCVPSYRR